MGRAAMIPVSDTIALADEEVSFTFIRASGPGGQNVNKVSTAAQLRFDVRASASLPEAAKSRLERLAGARLSADGVIVITARRHRSQERNRVEAIDRLVALIARALEEKPPRRPTRPGKAVKARRAAAKVRRASVKALRQAPSGDD